MRIGLLTEMYLPVVSGVTHFVSLHKKTLEEMGHEPFVFTFGPDNSFDEESRIVYSQGIPVSDIGYYLNISLSKRARHLVRTMDVLHAQHPFIVGQLAIRYRKRYHIPAVFTNHTRYDLYFHHYLPFLPESVGVAFWEVYLPSFARQLDLIIAPSAKIRDLIRNKEPTAHVEFIPNGIEVERFHSPAKRRDKMALGIPESAQVLIYVGRLGTEKNLALLLRAFAAVASALPDTHLVLVGEGMERDNLQEEAARLGLGRQVVFTGKVSYDDVPAYLAMADAFVTASVTEVHPLSVLEAMAAGLPVLGIDSPGVGEIIVDGQNGLLSGNDLAEFSVRLYRLMSDHELRARLARQARADSAQYDIRTTTRRIVSCYEEVIAAHQAKRQGIVKES